MATITGTGGNDVLDGSDQDDEIYGQAGNDVLRGGHGSNILNGGDGIDTVDYSDRIQRMVISLGDVPGTVSVASDGVETDWLFGIENATGGAGDDSFQGNSLANIFVGGGGNDILDGGAGADTMIGGVGEDNYYVDDPFDVVIEAAGQGYDHVSTTLASTTIQDNVEELIAIGTFGQTLFGKGTNDKLLSQGGSDRLFGEGGNDYLRGESGDDFLDAGSGDDLIRGDEGNDGLVGGTGADMMFGGVGDDAYIVDDPGDQAIEIAGEGRDTVYAIGSHALAQASAIEVLTAYDRASIDASTLTGNAFGQAIYGTQGNNGLIGGGGSDQLYGLGGDDAYIVDDASDQVIEFAGQGRDTVYTLGSYALSASSEVEILTAYDRADIAAINLAGSASNNILYGNMGANGLIGGGGTDTFYGLGGDDSYLVDDASDLVIEAVGGGRDTVYAQGNFALAAGSEVEVLIAYDRDVATALQLTGNALANTIIGDAGANVLDGKGGADVLYGLGGADSFRFSAAPTPGAAPAVIGDFAGGQDKIALDDAVFAALAAGPLAASAFASGTVAADADDRIVYDSASGALWYDADGNGLGAAIQFATLQGHPALVAGDILIF